MDEYVIESSMKFGPFSPDGYIHIEKMSVKSIRRLDKIWKCKVLVINEELARSNHLIV